jgi:hypothetical protein
MNLTEEKFWVVRKWFYDPADTDMDTQYYSLDSALEALNETNMDGYDKGKTGSVYEVTATYTVRDVTANEEAQK